MSVNGKACIRIVTGKQWALPQGRAPTATGQPQLTWAFSVSTAAGVSNSGDWPTAHRGRYRDVPLGSLEFSDPRTPRVLP